MSQLNMKPSLHVQDVHSRPQSGDPGPPDSVPGSRWRLRGWMSLSHIGRANPVHHARRFWSRGEQHSSGDGSERGELVLFDRVVGSFGPPGWPRCGLGSIER
jgi:hypothetical protein